MEVQPHPRALWCCSEPTCLLSSQLGRGSPAQYKTAASWVRLLHLAWHCACRSAAGILSGLQADPSAHHRNLPARTLPSRTRPQKGGQPPAHSSSSSWEPGGTSRPGRGPGVSGPFRRGLHWHHNAGRKGSGPSMNQAKEEEPRGLQLAPEFAPLQGKRRPTAGSLYSEGAPWWQLVTWQSLFHPWRSSSRHSQPLSRAPDRPYLGQQLPSSEPGEDPQGNAGRDPCSWHCAPDSWLIKALT